MKQKNYAIHKSGTNEIVLGPQMMTWTEVNNELNKLGRTGYYPKIHKEGSVAENESRAPKDAPAVKKGPAMYCDSGQSGTEGEVRMRFTNQRGEDLAQIMIEDHFGYDWLLKKKLKLTHHYGKLVLETEPGVWTNNHGELAAIATSLTYLLTFKGKIKKLYSDSEICIRFWLQTGKIKNCKNPNTQKLLDHTVGLYKKFKALGGSVEHVASLENLADLK